MAHPVLDAPRFTDEAAAFAHVEALLWPNGPICPHCKATGDQVYRLAGKATRMGLHKCRSCKGQFTVRQGTVFEASHLPLHLWLQVIHLMAASKKGVSTRQIQRMLNCSMKTAWHLTHRVREAMREGDLAPMGGGGGIVESDETFIFQDPDAEPNRLGWRNMNMVLTLVDRTTGRARSTVMAVDKLNSKDVAAVLTANVSRETRLMTDEGTHYAPVGKLFADHQSVSHARGEYVRRQEPVVHSQTVENYYSVFKRGMKGVYQVCSKAHLHRYCGEFDFRYTHRSARGVEDTERAGLIVAGARGKRLTYDATRSGGTPESDGPQAPKATWSDWQSA